MRKFDDFNYWFLYKNCNEHSVVTKDTKEYICTINNKTLEITDARDSMIDDIREDFIAYTCRDEYLVGKRADVAKNTLSELKTFYEKLLNGVNKIKMYKNGLNPDDFEITETIGWLRSTDFFRAPASTIFHESHDGGLLIHSLSVYNSMLDLIQIPEFESVTIESATLCCLTHDWCKINLYKKYKRNVKNEDTGKWEQVDSFKRGEFEFPLGHGATSMYMVMKHFELSDEEALAIRWHQGRWNVCELELSEFSSAAHNYPMVNLLQFADQLAVTNY